MITSTRLTSSAARSPRRSSVVLSSRYSPLDRDVLALHVTEVLESLDKSSPEWRALRVVERDIGKNTDPVHLPRLLRLGSERRGEEGEGAEEGAAIHYSITWSAR